MGYARFDTDKAFVDEELFIQFGTVLKDAMEKALRDTEALAKSAGATQAQAAGLEKRLSDLERGYAEILEKVMDRIERIEATIGGGAVKKSAGVQPGSGFDGLVRTAFRNGRSIRLT